MFLYFKFCCDADGTDDGLIRTLDRQFPVDLIKERNDYLCYVQLDYAHHEPVDQCWLGDIGNCLELCRRIVCWSAR